MKEVWKVIPGYEGLYEVSNIGTVRSIRRGKTMKPRLTEFGYLRIGLHKDGKQKGFPVHRLVITAFGNSSNLEVNHIDGVKTNNNIDNLEWVTSSENHLHAYRIGLSHQKKRDENYRSKVTSKQIEEIIKSYFVDKQTLLEISRKYNVSFSLIGYLIRGNSDLQSKLEDK